MIEGCPSGQPSFFVEYGLRKAVLSGWGSRGILFPAALPSRFAVKIPGRKKFIRFRYVIMKINYICYSDNRERLGYFYL